VGFDQVPVDRLAKEGVDVLVADALAGPIEDEIFPVPDAWHQLNPQQVGEPEDSGGLALGIRVQDIRLDIGGVLQEPVEDVHRLPHTAGDEVAEEGNIRVRDVVVGDPTIAAVPDRVLGQQILLVQVELGAVRSGGLAGPPQPRQAAAVVAVDHFPKGGVQTSGGDMPPIGVRDLVRRNQTAGMAGGLPGAEIAAVAECGQDVAQHGVVQLRFGP
jgi:hypothetical protein